MSWEWTVCIVGTVWGIAYIVINLSTAWFDSSQKIKNLEASRDFCRNEYDKLSNIFESYKIDQRHKMERFYK